MAFAHIYAQSKRVVTSNAAPFTRIQMGACSSFPVIDWASETCAPVDRGLSVSQSMRHPLEILRSPTSARPFEQLVRGEFGEGSVGTPSASRRSPAAREPASLDRITVLDPHRSYGTTGTRWRK